VKEAFSLFAAAATFGAVACSPVEPPRSTGAGAPLESGSMAIVASDYRSTNIALRSPSGEPLSRSLLSTASASGAIAFALSGDVVLPSNEIARDGELVVIDRYGTNVVTFVDPVGGVVRAQIPLGTGFESNPHDALPLGDGTLLVSRFGVDPRRGDEAFDGGDDVLVVDVGAPRIRARIALPEKEGIAARPGSFTRLGDRVLVNLARLSSDFARAVDADVAVLALDPPRLERIVPLPRLRNCGKLAVSPSGAIAISCSGLFDPARTRFADEGAGVAIGAIDEAGAFVVERRWEAADLGQSPTGSVVWLDDATVLFETYGAGATGDAVHVVSRDRSATAVAYRARAPFVLGPMRCRSTGEVRCFVTDATAAALVAFVTDSTATEEGPRVRAIPIPDVTGLPVRDVVFFR
jgi:hypothetical protein